MCYMLALARVVCMLTLELHVAHDCSACSRPSCNFIKADVSTNPKNMEPISKLAEDRLLRKFWPALSTLLLAKKMRIAIHALTLWLVPLIHIATVAAFPHRKHQSPSRRDLFTSRRDSGFLSAGPSNKFYRRSLPTHVFALSRDYWHSPSGQRPKATGSSTSLSSPERSTLVKRGGLRLSRENLQILNDRLSKEAYSQPERPPWESDKIPSYRADRGNSETEGVAVEGKSSRRACVFSLKKKSMQREDCGDKRHGHGLGENRRRRAHASRYHKKDNQRDKRRKSDSQGKKDHISRPRHQYYRKVNSQESGLDRIEPGSPHPADSMNFFSSRPDLAQAATRHHGDLEEDLSNPVVLGLLEKHHSSVRFVPPDEEQAHRRPPLYHPQLHDDSSHIRQKPSRVKDSAEDLMSGDKRTTVPADSKEGKAAEQSANHSGSKEAGEKSPEKKNDGEQSSATKKEDGKRGFYQRLDRVFKWSLLGTVIGVRPLPYAFSLELRTAESGRGLSSVGGELRPRSAQTKSSLQ